jgi:rubrerythrin
VVRKGVAVWVLGSLTFLAGLHSLDGFLWLTGNQSQSVFLTLYPFTKLLGSIGSDIYLLCSLTAVFLLWGATTIVALRNPIEAFLGKVLEDGKRENDGDVELLETRTSILEMMCETLENNSKMLSGLRDVVFNVRSEVLNLEPLEKRVESLKSDVKGLKKIMKRLETEIRKYQLCPACGREIMEKFRLCPYCGENLLKPRVKGETVMVKALPTPRVRKHE